VLGCLLIGGQALGQGQYQVFAWENFESGQFPGSLEMAFSADRSSVYVVPYNAPGMPPGILEGIAEVECGKFGLRFDATPDKRFLSVVNQSILDRRLLGTQGKALYQADFYFPPEGYDVPNCAVLATVKSVQGAETSWRNYRLGILDGNKVYFSYTDGLKKKGEPVMYKQQTLSEGTLQRPGWHRLQIIFDGQENILCSLDGKATSFSPVVEPTLVQLQAGLMVTVPEGATMTAIADNLSIQWTNEDLPLPDSPWAGGASTASYATMYQGVQPTVAAAAPTAPGAASAADTGQINWLLSPTQGWEVAQAQGKPVLVLLYTPYARYYQELERIFSTDAEARRLVNQFVPVRVDANQLIGGTLAQQFGIFRVPTFLVMGLDSQEKGRVTFDANTPWATVAGQLQRSLTGGGGAPSAAPPGR
jgi:hypothetical protein